MADLKIPPKARVRVYWEDLLENYTKKGKNEVISHFSRKYGVAKNMINVVFRPIRIDNEGNRVGLTDLGIDNINDVTHQRRLFEAWLRSRDINVNFDRLIALDNRVNAAVNLGDGDARYRKWGLKWIKIDNFLSFGPSNALEYDKLAGLTVVTSDPPNQGGKTVFSIDAFMFLCFGQTTKTSKNEDIFNTFTDKDKVSVSGLIQIEGGEEYIIERILTRKPKQAGGWTIKSTVNYHEVEPDGTKSKKPINQKEEHGKETTKKIRDAIGTLSDFEVTIIATANTLENLIETLPTQRGKLLTKFIGLEIIEKKEKVAREMHSKFQKTMKSNIYNIPDLVMEIENHNSQIEMGNATLVNFNRNLDSNNALLKELHELKDTLISRKKEIDIDILKLNPATLANNKKTIINNGKTYKVKVDEIKGRITEIGEVEFDEDVYVTVSDNLVSDTIKKGGLDKDLEKLKELKDILVNGEICPECERRLDDVDHTDQINETQAKIEKLTGDIEELAKSIEELTKEKTSLEGAKKLIDEKDKLELKQDKYELEMDRLRLELTELNNQIKDYKNSMDDIDNNKKIESDILRQNVKIENLGIEKDKITRNIQRITDDIEVNRNEITKKEELITKINEEDEIDRIFKIYIEMVGKKGISKMVLRTVLPIINAEVQRLLDETCDFDLELQMNDKNDVEFILIKDGVNKDLKSGSGLERTLASLALRCILGRISVLPKPNIIVFDEILGKIANENYENVKQLFDKIKDMFDTVLMITHEPIVKDWADNVLTIKKTNNVSKIEVL